MRVVVLTLVFGLVAGASVDAPAARRTAELPERPRTLAVAQGPILAFAQDGSRIAWVEQAGSRRCSRVVIHVVPAGRRTVLPAHLARAQTCRWRAPARTWLALAGGRALWGFRDLGAHEFDVGETRHDVLFSASASDPTERRVASLSYTRGGAGRFVVDVGGDGETLAYVAWEHAYEDPRCTAPGPGCRSHLARSDLRRLVRGSWLPVPTPAPATTIAVASTRLAVSSHAELGVDVRSARSGALVRRIKTWGHVFGTPRSLAITPRFVAALSLSSIDTPAVERHSIASRHARVLPVSCPSTCELAASGRAIVLRAGRSIRMVDIARRRTLVVARAAADPIGVSIEGRRIAWAENIGGRGRVRSVTLP